MPYNKQTAIENQKAFLRSQAKCGFPNIELRAKETLKRIEDREKQEKLQTLRIQRFNEEWSKKRSKKK